MPVFNAEQYLTECLSSIIHQTYQNWELIAINDFSTDGSLKLLSTFAQNDSRIKVFNNEHKGIINALRLAYSKSTGNLISRMDADDIMPKQKLEFLENALKNKENTVATGFVQYFSDGNVGNGYKKYEQWLNSLMQSENNFSEIYKECVIPSPCWLMAKATLNKIGAFDFDIYPEDYDLCFRMYQHKLKVVNVKEICHLWRDHATRASRNDSNYANNTFIDLKCHYFLLVDYNKNKELILWGAGTKGKQIAKYLNNKNIPFTWLCNNEKKVGHIIYKQKMLHYKSIIPTEKQQFIVAVANGDEQKEIKALLRNKEVWFFV